METNPHSASIAERLYDAVAPLVIPREVRGRCEDLVIETVGLCVAARRSDYVRVLLESVDGAGVCTVIGQPGGYSAEDAAMINGTAAHGEDFDDTFEGGPVHSGAVIVPAVLAACERFGRDGTAALRGIAIGVEVLCRLSLVAPKLIHKAGYHPTSVLGAMGATLAASITMGLNRKQTVDALGVAGSMAGGIIEYLAEGAWTKRLHAGWAARVGLHAARIGQSGFLGPRTVFEGTHGLFFAFAHTDAGDFDALLGGLGEKWHLNDITFKPYATGTMNQPYIDCALRLAKKGRVESFAAEDIADVLCETAEGYVHRLWEPLTSKHRPATEYGAKFSTPFNIAVAFVTGGAGLQAFTAATVANPRVLALAGKVRYVIDPDNPYPKAYTGHIRITLKDGRVFEERQPHIRGGKHEPLSRDEIEQKFRGNARHGGWSEQQAGRCIQWGRRLFDGAVDLSLLRQAG